MGTTSPARPTFGSMWLRFQDVAPDADHSYPEGAIKSLAKIGGADHKNYIFPVRQMVSFIGDQLGTPDISKGPEARRNDFIGRKGIVAFGVPFADASGHVTLWDGQQAADEDYFDPVSRHNLPLIDARLCLCP